DELEYNRLARFRPLADAVRLVDGEAVRDVVGRERNPDDVAFLHVDVAAVSAADAVAVFVRGGRGFAFRGGNQDERAAHGHDQNRGNGREPTGRRSRSGEVHGTLPPEGDVPSLSDRSRAFSRPPASAITELQPWNSYEERADHQGSGDPPEA